MVWWTSGDRSAIIFSAPLFCLVTCCDSCKVAAAEHALARDQGHDLLLCISQARICPGGRSMGSVSLHHPHWKQIHTYMTSIALLHLVQPAIHLDSRACSRYHHNAAAKFGNLMVVVDFGCAE